MTLRLATLCRIAARLSYLACAACICLGGVQPHASAQDGADPTRDASARVLFEQGVELAERGDWAGAEDRYRRALALRASPVIAYNLASALSEQGKLIEASETLHRVVGDESTDPELHKAATQLYDGLSARIGRVLIQVKGQQLGDSVVLDGRVLHMAQLNVEIPSDPGAHQLRLERAGQTVDIRSFSLAPAGREEITLAAPALAPAAPAALSTSAAGGRAALQAQASSAATAKSSSILTRWWFWTGAIAVVAIGTVVGVAAASGGSRAEPAYQGNLSPGSVQVEVAP